MAAENNPHSYLVDWIINYLKNRDLMHQNIESIETNKNGFDVYIKFKDKGQFFIVKPIIEKNDDIMPKFNEEGYFGLVMFNTLSNFNFLVKDWMKLAKFKRLSVYFVNPFSQLDKKWIICPYVHNSICDENALEKGLRAMFEMVEPITEDQIKDRFK